MSKLIPLEAIEKKIFFIRDEKVIHFGHEIDPVNLDLLADMIFFNEFPVGEGGEG